MNMKRLVAFGLVLSTALGAFAEPHIGVFLWQVNRVAEQEKIPLAEAARRVKALGIEGFDAYVLERDKIPVLLKEGLKPASLYAFFHMEKTNETVRLEQYLATAVEFGFKRLMVIPGDFPRGGIDDTDAERAQTYAAIAAQMKPFVARAKAKGLTVTIEPFDSWDPTPCASVAGLETLFAAVPDLMLTFDTGNFTFACDDTLKTFERHRSRIRHVHLKDRLYAPAKDGRVWGDNCALGAGVKPIAEIVRRLNAEGYDGWLVVELFTPNAWADTETSMKYLKSLLGGKAKE